MTEWEKLLARSPWEILNRAVDRLIAAQGYFPYIDPVYWQTVDHARAIQILISLRDLCFALGFVPIPDFRLPTSDSRA